jgi:hypothetical protein
MSLTNYIKKKMNRKKPAVFLGTVRFTQPASSNPLSLSSAPDTRSFVGPRCMLDAADKVWSIPTVFVHRAMGEHQGGTDLGNHRTADPTAEVLD